MKAIIEVPLICSIKVLVMRLPSLNQLMLGGGVPSALQLKLKWRPGAIISCFPIGYIVILGGEGSRSNHSRKLILLFGEFMLL